jgi:hypothetical protein
MVARGMCVTKCEAAVSRGETGLAEVSDVMIFVSFGAMPLLRDIAV